MKKVGIVVPTAKNGGAEKQALFLMRALKDNYECYYVILNPGKEKEPDWDKQDLNDNCHIVRLKSRNLYGQYKEILSLCKSLQIDILFGYLTKPDFLVSMVGRKLGIKDVYLGIRNNTLPKWKLVLELLANKYSKAVVINNYSGVERFSSQGMTNIKVITNCYLDFKSPISRTSNVTATIITVGRFVEQKDYETAIRVIAKVKETIPNIRYQIVGFGELEPKIRNWISKYNVADNVSLAINPPDVSQRLDKADIYLCTSIFEGTSNSIMEAMDASLPIVATNVGDNAILVRDGENGYITNCKDVDSIADRLIALSKDLSLRNKLGLKGNSLLRENFSFEKFKKEYLRLIES